MYLWECFDQQAYRDYILQALQDEVSVIKFISTIAERWTSLDTKSRSGYEFSSKEYCNYISIDQVIDNITNARMNKKFWELTPEQREIAATFILAFQDKVNRHDISLKQISELLNQWEMDFIKSHVSN